MKRFCVLTTGRSGSTSLMEAIQQCENVGLPDRDIGCDDYELLHPRKSRRYFDYYSQALSRPVETRSQLISAFFSQMSEKEFAGFKSMPNRHPDFSSFAIQDDITFITLVRKDIPSTVASFMMAMEKGTWRRKGGACSNRWTFEHRHAKKVLSNVRYLHNAFNLLECIPQQIRLDYESLCTANYHSEQLEEFFRAAITFTNPQSPTTGASYVSNWSEFQDFVWEAWECM